MNAPRKLVAILAADVAGYSRLTGLDEEGTHAQLQDHLRLLVDPKIAEHRGRIVKNTGDGMLAEFSSVVDAVRCAVDVQRGMAERNVNVPQETRIEFRIGVNLGDIIVDHGDIFGDGVNIAARLEGIAEPGGICISESAYHQVCDKLDASFEDRGEQQLKNIARPVRTYRVRLNRGPAQAKLALRLPDKPSIAVLPFQNMSGDAEQEYFADGVVEEIITALSRFRHLFVIARNSSFTYKGHPVDVKQVGRELGVRYVLEGSVRKAANRVRITAQLIDASTDAHLWADRFDGALDDIFGLQEQVATSVVGAIAPKLDEAELDRTKRKPTESLRAYDYFLRGMASGNRWTRESVSEAFGYFYKAIDLDRDFASAYGMAAWCSTARKLNFWMGDREQEIAEAGRLARRAVELGNDDAVALSSSGFALAYVVGDVHFGSACIDRALVLNPNLASTWIRGGWVQIFLGETEPAINRLARAMRLSPLDPFYFAMQGATAWAHCSAGRYDQALMWAEKATKGPRNYLPAIIVLITNSLAGRIEEARNALERLRQVSPALTFSSIKEGLGPHRPEEMAGYEEGLRKAGLQE